MFLNDVSSWVDEIFGGWAVSGVVSWHTGYPWQTASNAFVASYSNDAPAILTGNPALAKNAFDQAAGRWRGEHVPQCRAASRAVFGTGRIHDWNPQRPARSWVLQCGPWLGQDFPLDWEGVSVKFRADAFNALNHPNFTIPTENVFNGYDQEDILQGPKFGQISFTANPNGNKNSGARVLQLCAARGVLKAQRKAISRKGDRLGGPFSAELPRGVNATWLPITFQASSGSSPGLPLGRSTRPYN